MGVEAKKTVSHAGIYALGNILRNAVSIIMLPVYTRFLSPQDYGVIELLSMLMDFVGIIFGMRLAEAIFRYYFDAGSDAERKSVISTSLFLSFALNAIGVLLVMLLAEPLAHLLFGGSGQSNYIRLFSLTLLLEAVTAVPMIFVRAQQRPWLFIAFNLFKLAMQLSLNIYLIVIKGMRVEGVIYSALISGVVMACVLTVYTLSKVGMHTSYNVLGKVARFSIPLILATIGSFYLTFGDRYFLRVFGNLSEVGIYALGYKFGFILTVLMWDPFEKIWASQRYEVHRRPDALDIFRKTFVFMSLLMIAAALGISLFVKDLLDVMSAPAFHPAHAIVPIVLIAYVLQAWTSFCNFGLLLKHKTGQIAYGSTIAVAVITVAYLTLIPLFGIFGAAWATVIGFAARFYWIERQSTLEYDMLLPWRKIAAISSLAICVYLLSLFVPDRIFLSLAVRACLYLLFVASIILLPILSPDEKSVIIRILKEPHKIKQVFA